MTESTTYQMILEEGEARGIALGEARGELSAARKIVLAAGAKRLGEADAATLDAIARIDSFERLESMTLRVSEVESWSELLNDQCEGP